MTRPLNRGEMGRGSAGSRARSLDEVDVRNRLAQLLKLPRSQERTLGLAKVRKQLRNIADLVRS